VSETVSVALGELAADMREGLLALAVVAGLQVMAAIMEQHVVGEVVAEAVGVGEGGGQWLGLRCGLGHLQPDRSHRQITRGPPDQPVDRRAGADRQVARVLSACGRSPLVRPSA
jgi:hypothetical protein